MKEGIIIFLIMAFSVGAFVGLAYVASHYRNKRFNEAILKSGFESGQMVKLKVDGRLGQVTTFSLRGDKILVYVRLERPTATISEHFIGSGGSIGFSGYSTVGFFPYELVAVE